MSEYNFYLFKNKRKERFIYYICEKGDKVILDFSKIPFTTESLFEDILDGFTAFPFMRELSDYRHDDTWLSAGLTMAQLVYGMVNDLDDLVSLFDEMASVKGTEYSVTLNINADLMNESEKLLFEELPLYFEKYCQENNIEFCSFD